MFGQCVVGGPSVVDRDREPIETTVVPRLVGTTLLVGDEREELLFGLAETERLRIGFHGTRRTLDLGKINGECFAVMAGAGFDGAMIRQADRSLKDRLGRLAYVWTALQHVKDRAVPVKIHIDGSKWFDGKASCVLLGNVGMITGGIRAFDDAKPDDGWLELGVTTAEGALAWARTLGRMAAGRSDRSPFVRITRAKAADITFGAPMTYELDGGARESVTRLKARINPGALTLCVPGPR